MHGCITVGNPQHKIMEYRSKMNIISGLSVDKYTDLLCKLIYHDYQ